ncbi:MerR family transcriptional regulator [Streptomyces sp. AC536]|uniref:MerR family transcriptional regulator n=1 Tax=Streptomyces buecherae TaxID=2763006 RepID=UPI00164E2323|nr:MerR family transcriptional regulator [Streptomyces buecherae]QNJ43440.1 MerR family transcriptional regulator [Streptomyces buecherae]
MSEALTADASEPEGRRAAAGPAARPAPGANGAPPADQAPARAPEPTGAGGSARLGLTVDELAARAGVTVRTVRFYGTRGLLPPPHIGPRRVGRYGPEHLSRLALIEELQHHGMTLAAIERYLQQLPTDISAHDLAIHRALVASWTPDVAEEAGRDLLERRAGRPLTEGDLDRLAAMDVLERTADPDVFRVDPAILHLGVRLLDVPIPLETLRAARTVVLDHARASARELSRLFRDEVWGPYRERESDPAQVSAMKSLSAHMQPMVVQALVTAFQRSLREELRAAYGTQGAPAEDGGAATAEEPQGPGEADTAGGAGGADTRASGDEGVPDRERAG